MSLYFSLVRTALSIATIGIIAAVLAGCPDPTSTPGEDGNRVASPRFSPGTGTYYAIQNVAITCETPDATIYYTTDGTAPDQNSATYTNPIAVERTTTLSAIAVKSGMEDSAISAATIGFDVITPSTAPASGANVLFEIYTIDEITPPGDLTITVNNYKDYSTATYTTTEVVSDIDGLSLHRVWANVPDVVSYDSFVQIYNPEGNEALGLGEVVEPWWRRLEYGDSSQVVRSAWILDDSLTQYAYREIIRNWSDTAGTSTLAVSGRVTDESGSDISGTAEVGYGHQVRDGHYYIDYNDSIGTVSVSGSFNLTFPVRRTSMEAELSFRDYVRIYVEKNYYTSGSTELSYDSTEVINQLAVILYANRIVSFDWVYSAIPVVGTATAQQGTINSANSYSFPDAAVADDFYASFADARLDENLSRYHLDDDATRDSSTDDIYVYLSSYSSNLYLRSGASYSISRLGTGDLSNYYSTDLSTLSYTYSYTLTGTGEVFAIKTTDGGYALVRIADIHIMTPAEMTL